MIESTNCCVKGAFRTFSETVICAEIFESGSSCLFASYSVESEKLCDLMIATSVECHGTSLCSAENISCMKWSINDAP